MALFAHTGYLRHFDSPAFIKVHGPGDLAPYTGIYKCESCGHEIANSESQPLPKLAHLGHPTDSPISWRLIVYAQQNCK